MIELQAEISRVKKEMELSALQVESYKGQVATLQNDNIKSI